MTDCAKYRDFLSAFADGELCESEVAELMEHIAQCEDCARLLEEYKEISAAFEASEPVPEGFTAKVMTEVANINRTKRITFLTRRVLPLAACLVLAVGAVRFLPRMNGAAPESALFNGAGAAADDAMIVADSAPMERSDAKMAPESEYDMDSDAYAYNDAADDAVAYDMYDAVTDSSAADMPRSESAEAATEPYDGAPVIHSAIVTVYCDADIFLENKLPPEMPASVRGAVYTDLDGMTVTVIPQEDMDLFVNCLTAMEIEHSISIADGAVGPVRIEIISE